MNGLKGDNADFESVNHFVDAVLSSYETRIQSMNSFFSQTHQIFEGFHGFLLETKTEREKKSAELRETLAKHGSLRRKDFDVLMKGLLSAQNESEKEVKYLLNRYVLQQMKMAQTLKASLGRFRECLLKGEKQRLAEFQVMINKILVQQNLRKDEVTSQLKKFQKEQRELAARLNDLLSKGKDVRSKDLKALIQEFQKQQRERCDGQKTRKKMVRNMMEKFRDERVLSARITPKKNREPVEDISDEILGTFAAHPDNRQSVNDGSENLKKE